MRLLAGVLPLGMIMLATMPFAAQGNSPVECSVVRTQEGNTVHLVAQVQSSTKLSGTYRFEVVKAGGAGSSQVQQSGDFSVQANKATAISSTEIGIGDKAKYEARLLVKWPGGQQECTLGDAKDGAAPKKPSGMTAGGGNTSKTTQHGAGNQAFTRQSGSGNSSVIIQSN